jgi:hypothetical protein
MLLPSTLNIRSGKRKFFPGLEVPFLVQGSSKYFFLIGGNVGLLIDTTQTAYPLPLDSSFKLTKMHSIFIHIFICLHLVIKEIINKLI